MVSIWLTSEPPNATAARTLPSVLLGFTIQRNNLGRAAFWADDPTHRSHQAKSLIRHRPFLAQLSLSIFHCRTMPDVKETLVCDPFQAYGGRVIEQPRVRIKGHHFSAAAVRTHVALHRLHQARAHLGQSNHREDEWVRQRQPSPWWLAITKTESNM